MDKDFKLFMKSQGVSGATMHGYQNIISQSKNIPFQSGYMNPSIIEERQLNVASMDVFSRLMMDRIIFLGTAIDDTVANIVNGQLLYLHSIGADKPIDMYINSPGGGVYAGLSMVDTMDYITPDVNTVVTGMAASMGYVLAINGKHRSALRHSRLMQHQPMGGASGQASDIEITAKQIGILKSELYNIIVDKTGQPYEKVDADCDRDYWMTAEEAKAYGAIDEVIARKPIV